MLCSHRGVPKLEPRRGSPLDLPREVLHEVLVLGWRSNGLGAELGLDGMDYRRGVVHRRGVWHLLLEQRVAKLRQRLLLLCIVIDCL